jgi:hypothetical protein
LTNWDIREKDLLEKEKMIMSELIYLVGQISPIFEETYQWRRDIKKYFISEPSIKFIDPCANPFNKKVLEEKRYALSSEERRFGIDVLPSKDYTFCSRSSMAIVNMNHYDKNKPMLGSFFELGWYYTMPGKTVIGFADDLNDYQVQNPFVQQAVKIWVTNWKEACYIVEEYFLNEE